MPYHLDITKKGRKALMKENTSIDINEKRNGTFYLPKGMYTVSIDGVSKPLEIK